MALGEVGAMVAAIRGDSTTIIGFSLGIGLEFTDETTSAKIQKLTHHQNGVPY